MAPSKGIAVLGHFLLTSPVLPPAPGSAAPALLSLSHPPCALFSLPTLNWCCPARPGSFPGFALSVESGEDSKSLSACLRAPSTPSIPQHHPGAAGWSLPSFLGSVVGWECSRGPREGTGAVFTLSASPRASPPCAHPTAEHREGEWQCCLGMEQGKGFVWIPWSSLWLL